MQRRLLIILVLVLIFSTLFSVNVFALDKVKITEGTYILESKLGTNMVMDVDNASTNSGANIQLYKYNGSSAQQFTIKKSGSYYTITPKCSGLKVDVQGGSTKSGANVQQYKSNSTDSQKWQFYDAGNGYYYIRCKIGDKALDVKGGKASNGTNIWMYNLNKTDSQKWKLVKVDTIQIQGHLYTPWGRQMPCEKAALYSSDGRKLGSFTGNDYDFELNATMRSTDTPSYIVVETTCAGTPMKGTYQLKYSQIRELCNSKKLYISCLSVNSR